MHVTTGFQQRISMEGSCAWKQQQKGWTVCGLRFAWAFFGFANIFIAAEFWWNETLTEVWRVPKFFLAWKYLFNMSLETFDLPKQKKTFLGYIFLSICCFPRKPTTEFVGFVSCFTVHNGLPCCFLRKRLRTSGLSDKTFGPNPWSSLEFPPLSLSLSLSLLTLSLSLSPSLSLLLSLHLSLSLRGWQNPRTRTGIQFSACIKKLQL